MKKFSNVKIVLFDSTAAFFKLSVEAIFTKKRPDNTLAPLAYVTDQGTAHLNPNIYLVITYKTEAWETTKNLYTSFPQLYKIREALEMVKELVVSKIGYTEVESVLTVNPQYQNPIVISDIGQKNKWIAFTLQTIVPEEGSLVRVPAVSIELSDAEGFVSILTIEEFLTIYTIIKDLDLTAYQIMLSGMFLDAEDQPVVYQQQQRQYQPAPQQQSYQQPQQQSQQQQPAQQSQRKFGNTPYQQPQQRTAPVSRQTTAPVQQEQPIVVQQPQQRAPQQSNNLQPRRNEQTIVNLKNIEEVPVSQFKLNDADAIEAIFDDEK